MGWIYVFYWIPPLALYWLELWTNKWFTSEKTGGKDNIMNQEDTLWNIELKVLNRTREDLLWLWKWWYRLLQLPPLPPSLSPSLPLSFLLPSSSVSYISATEVWSVCQTESWSLIGYNPSQPITNKITKMMQIFVVTCFKWLYSRSGKLMTKYWRLHYCWAEWRAALCWWSSSPSTPPTL